MTTAAWDVLHTQRRHALNYPSEHVVRFLISCRDNAGAKTMLDVGCGAGRHMRLATELGLEPTGIDSSQQALDQAGAYGPVQLADMTALPFPDESFDIVLAFGTVYYATKDVTRAALLEIRRVLTINGHALVSLRTERDWRAGHLALNGVGEVVFRMASEPEDGMVINFTGREDIDWIGREFAGMECEIAETTSRQGSRLNSDWLVVVRKG